MVAAGFQRGFQFGRGDAVEFAHDLTAQVVLDFQVDVVEQVERDVRVAHERGMEDRVHFGAFGDALVGFAAHARGAVFEQ